MKKKLKPGDPCPSCSHGMGWPLLESSGRAEPEDLRCPVCDKLFDSRPGLAKKSQDAPGGKFHGGYDPKKPGGGRGRP
ncbi:MAG: hypothetical protein ISS67_07655 [Desulfobacterales bacterium]|uniref:Uncharacterized protein n=1 Tax=Candidatus Desulfatibia profunda TaxID=2841695 RepID=A0A8J6TG79_9BACT|nr:hypothetical protein [Candidatus Desulfatibia profunda]MBL7181242.1 hypothetical protein [Desulfobacterales bacterium]MBL7208375.1 hypothetical protein [Desulfobacterales bacterium]